MKRADVEPYYGATVLITVAIPSLDDAVYIGRLSPLRGSSRLKRSCKGRRVRSAQTCAYARTARDGTARVCAHRDERSHALSDRAITSIKRLDD